MEATVVTTTWSEVIRGYRDHAGLSREALGRQVDLSAVMIEKYENGSNRPSQPAAERLDAFLEAGGAILASCGFTPPRDWGPEMDQIRGRVGELSQEVAALRSILAALTATVELLHGERPPESPNGQ